MYLPFLMVFAALGSAHADTFADSRVRLLAHGHLDVGQNNRVALNCHFIPAGNLMGDLAPLAYFGAEFSAAPWLKIEPVIGWTFGGDQPIASVRFAPSIGRTWAWTDFEFQPIGHDSYWFVQADYKVSDHLHFGLEDEGWGNFDDTSTMSNGFGPDLLVRSGMMGVDFAVHVRPDESGDFKPGFVFRIHGFLPGDSK